MNFETYMKENHPNVTPFNSFLYPIIRKIWENAYSFGYNDGFKDGEQGDYNPEEE